MFSEVDYRLSRIPFKLHHGPFNKQSYQKRCSPIAVFIWAKQKANRRCTLKPSKARPGVHHPVERFARRLLMLMPLFHDQLAAKRFEYD